MMYNLKPIKIADFKGLKPMHTFTVSRKPMKSFNFSHLTDTRGLRSEFRGMQLSQANIGFRPFMFNFNSNSRPYQGIKRNYPPNHRDMSYSDAYQLYGLKPFGDIDQDGTPNWRDCKPYDSTRDGKILDAVKGKIRKTFKGKDTEPEIVDSDTWETPVKQEEDWESPEQNLPVPYEPLPDNREQTSQLPARTDEIVPYQQTEVGPVMPQYEMDVTGVPTEEPKRGAEYAKPIGAMVDISSEPSLTEQEKSSLYERFKAGLGKGAESIRESFQKEEPIWDGLWRVYYRQKKGLWNLYGETDNESDAFNITSQLNSQPYIAEVWVDKKPADIMLNQLNRRLTKERFVGEVKDITERTKEGMTKIDSDTARELQRFQRRYAQGAPLSREMKRYIGSFDVRPQSPMYRQRATDYGSTPRGYDLGFSTTKTPYASSRFFDLTGGGSRPAPRSSQFYFQERKPPTNMYRSRDYSNRKVPPNAMGTGRVQQYNPVTARQSFLNPSRDYGDDAEIEYMQSQPSYNEERFTGFGDMENRPRGLGLTGGQKRLSYRRGLS